MRYSKLLIPTVKEVPAEAEIPSHQLMIRAGFIRKLASGTYTYLPLGWKVLRKIMDIVRAEMDAAGAQEISMPILQPVELWQQTGRDVVFQEIICSFTDRHGRGNILAPTAEEVVTSLVAGEVSSYKQLPINLYQINTKFRDEFRPRFGVLRSREFIMKDAYSFDATVEGLDESYRKMYDAYCRIFNRTGLKYVTVEAESGGMGGTDTEEFMVPCSAGEDVILTSDKGNYAANVEICQTGRAMPGDDYLTLPAVQPVGELTEVATPNCTSIEEVSAFLKAKPRFILKSVLFEATFTQDAAPSAASATDKIKYVVVVVRGDHHINEARVRSQVRAIFAAKYGRTLLDLKLADQEKAKKDGFCVGYMGPHVNAREDTAVVFDVDVLAGEKGAFWAAGANKEGCHVKYFSISRDMIADRVSFGDIRDAMEGDPSPKNDGGILKESRGVEIGHVFKLGTKYSKQLGATFLDEKGVSQPCIMGCYGIGVNRIFAAAIEIGFDQSGCILPISIAPFEAEVLPTNNNSPEVVAEAERIYNELRSAGVDVLLDDRDARAGVKFKDADLLGIPLRIVVGDRGLKEGQVEIKRRIDEKPTLVAAAAVVAEAVQIVQQMKAALTGERM